ncbi:hypothetical protein AVEN_179876-1, partial [Araneus ventricosus]
MTGPSRQQHGYYGSKMAITGSCTNFFRKTPCHWDAANKTTSPVQYPPGKRDPASLYVGFSSMDSCCSPVGRDQ